MAVTVDIICVIDRSGSMMSIVDDAIGGFNSLLDDQKKIAGEASMTVVLFDHEYQMLHNRRPLHTVEPLSRETYIPRGSTALLDAMGKALSTAQTWGQASAEHKYIVAVITDGQENASHEWSSVALKALVDNLTAQGWVFIYVAANQDAFTEAAKYGMANLNTTNFAATGVGTRGAYASTSATMSNARGVLPPDTTRKRSDSPTSSDWDPHGGTTSILASNPDDDRSSSSSSSPE